MRKFGHCTVVLQRRWWNFIFIRYIFGRLLGRQATRRRTAHMTHACRHVDTKLPLHTRPVSSTNPWEVSRADFIGGGRPTSPAQVMTARPPKSRRRHPGGRTAGTPWNKASSPSPKRLISHGYLGGNNSCPRRRSIRRPPVNPTDDPQKSQSLPRNKTNACERHPLVVSFCCGICSGLADHIISISESWSSLLSTGFTPFDGFMHHSSPRPRVAYPWLSNRLTTQHLHLFFLLAVLGFSVFGTPPTSPSFAHTLPPPLTVHIHIRAQGVRVYI